MATTQLGAFLRRLRTEMSTSGATDGQLLQAFVARREEAAFTALVKRHGPMILGVCRRILPNDADAEDVFQATFLALARKGASVRNPDSVGSWLYGVASRLAVKVRAQSRRRQACQNQGGIMKAAPGIDLAWQELQAALHEALADLPEKYRTPLVLYYLEGKTGEEAARELGCPVGTIRSRVAQGRNLVRQQLVRRGLGLSAGTFVAALSGTTATAAVPVRLLQPTIKAALGLAAGLPAKEVTAPKVAALLHHGLQGLLAAKVKVATGLVLAASLLGLCLGSLVHSVLAPTEATAEENAILRASPVGSTATKKWQPAPQGASQDVSVGGRVLSPDGKPAEGAHVALVTWVRHLDHRGQVLLPESFWTALTDRPGKFRLGLPGPAHQRVRRVDVIVAAEGYGLNWRSFDPTVGQLESPVELLPEQVIRGRLFDLQGQPAVGVQVQAIRLERKIPRKVRAFQGDLERDEFSESRSLSFYAAPPDGLSPWPDHPAQPAGFSPWPESVKTDEEGRFTIRGVGQDLEVTLLARGERFAPHRFRVDTSTGGRAGDIRQVLSPARVLEGVITYADTNEPVPHAQVCTGGTAGRADEKGRYRLTLISSGPPFVIAAAPKPAPYLVKKEALPQWPKGWVKQKLDVALPRGIHVRGKVTESPSGKPVAGAAVRYTAQAVNNPHLKEAVYDIVTGRGATMTGPDGTFEIAALPGPGYLLVDGPSADYSPREFGHGLLHGGKSGGQRESAHALVTLNLKPVQKTAEVDVTLRRGVVLQFRVVGPEGQRVPEAQLLCRLNEDYAFLRGPVTVRGSKFELRGYDPKENYRVLIIDPNNHWGAVAEVSGPQDSPITIRLRPNGSAQVRFLDEEDKPLMGYRPRLAAVLTPERDGLGADVALVAGPSFWGGGPGAADVKTDQDGRCVFTDLIPGATYRFWDRDGKKEFTVEAGKRLALKLSRIGKRPSMLE